MPDYLLPSLLIQILAIGYSPGPANIYSLSMALRYGRKASLKMWLGLLSGFLTAIVAVALLVHLAGIAFKDYIYLLRYPGAAYIIYLSWKIYKSRELSDENRRPCSFLNGYIVQLTNAKMILFDVSAFCTFVLPYSDRFLDLLKVAAWLLIAGPGANIVWLVFGGFFNRFVISHKRQIDFISAIALAACAIYILIS